MENLEKVKRYLSVVEDTDEEALDAGTSQGARKAWYKRHMNNWHTIPVPWSQCGKWLKLPGASTVSHDEACDEEPFLPKNETLAKHREHCEAKPGNCPFERAADNTDVIPIYSNPKSGWRLIKKDGKTRMELDEKRERLMFGKQGSGVVRLKDADVEAWKKNPPEGWKLRRWGSDHKVFPIGGKEDESRKRMAPELLASHRKSQQWDRDMQSLSVEEMINKYGVKDLIFMLKLRYGVFE